MLSQQSLQLLYRDDSCKLQAQRLCRALSGCMGVIAAQATRYGQIGQVEKRSDCFSTQVCEKVVSAQRKRTSEACVSLLYDLYHPSAPTNNSAGCAHLDAVNGFGHNKASTPRNVGCLLKFDKRSARDDYLEKLDWKLPHVLDGYEGCVGKVWVWTVQDPC